MPKADQAEHGKRVETVRQLILSGINSERIVQTVTAEWKIKPRQGWNYVRQARALIAKISEQARPYLIAEHIAVRRSIRERARQAKDFRAELAAAQDEAKLFGLYPSEKVEIFDWRKEAQAVGIDPDSLADKLFAKVKRKVNADDPSDDTG